MKRPAELVAFLTIAPAVYGWLVSDTVAAPHVLAIVLAFVAGLVPLVVSGVKDRAVAPDASGDDAGEREQQAG